MYVRIYFRASSNFELLPIPIVDNLKQCGNTCFYVMLSFISYIFLVNPTRHLIENKADILLNEYILWMFLIYGVWGCLSYPGAIYIPLHRWDSGFNTDKVDCCAHIALLMLMDHTCAVYSETLSELLIAHLRSIFCMTTLPHGSHGRDLRSVDIFTPNKNARLG